MPAAHARFSPSAAERWVNCPGSVALSRDLPAQPPSRYAAEGSAAHTLAERAIAHGKPADFWIGEQIEHDGFVFTVDAEMAAYVQVYLDEVHARVGDGTLLAEQRVGFSEAIGVHDQFGTSDCIILSADGKRLVVGDLKYGQGVQVFAENNLQMLTYAVAVFETFDAVLDFSAVEEIELFICQPRLDHIDSWSTTPEQVREHAAKLRLAAGAAIEGLYALDEGEPIPDELFRVTEKGCQWCPARPTCAKHREFVSAIVFDDFKALDEPDVVAVQGAPSVPGSPDKLGQLFGVIDIVEGWCRAVRAEVERLVMAGTEVIGPDGERMKVVEGKKGNRSWSDADQAAAVLSTLLGPDNAYARKLLTPAQVEKALGKKRKQEFADMLAPLTTQAPGRPKVTLGSDPAPPWTGSAGADEFEVLGDGD